MKILRSIIISIAIIVLLAGCSGTDRVAADEIPEEQEEQLQEEEPSDDEAEETELPEVKEEIDLEAVKPNEAGEIMVLMYHHIKEPEAEWSRTPENFRKDLERLYEEGFRPISLRDYVAGNITTEAGFTPVVLTFDDGNQNNFNMLQNEAGEWVIDPDSAVAILVDFHEQHPDFPLKATFYINGGNPFGQKDLVEYKLNYIVEKGMEIGNHTNTHVDFTNAGVDKIQEEMSKLIQLVNRNVKDYEVNTLALPFGSKPKNQDLRAYLVEGSYEEVSYKNIAILEVGWDPYRSPFHKEFDFTRIRRVRASETKVDGVGMYDWIRAFEEGRRIRYISDGDVDIVTVPEKYQQQVEVPEGKSIRVY